MSIFEQASQQKIRFETTQGPLSVEDLWDLPLTTNRPNRVDLDTLAVNLNKQIQDAGTTSFVKKATRPNEILKLKFDIVLRVIEVRQVAEEAAETLRANSEKKQQILEIIHRKQNEALEGKSEEELRELVASL